MAAGDQGARNVTRQWSEYLYDHFATGAPYEIVPWAPPSPGHRGGVAPSESNLLCRLSQVNAWNSVLFVRWGSGGASSSPWASSDVDDGSAAPPTRSTTTTMETTVAIRLVPCVLSNDGRLHGVLQDLFPVAYRQLRTVVTSWDVEKLKPDPACFHVAARRILTCISSCAENGNVPHFHPAGRKKAVDGEPVGTTRADDGDDDAMPGGSPSPSGDLFQRWIHIGDCNTEDAGAAEAAGVARFLHVDELWSRLADANGRPPEGGGRPAPAIVRVVADNDEPPGNRPVGTTDVRGDELQRIVGDFAPFWAAVQTICASRCQLEPTITGNVVGGESR